MIWPRVQTILTSRRSRSRPVALGFVTDVTVRTNPDHHQDHMTPATGVLPVNGNACMIAGSAKTQPTRTPTRCRPTGRPQADVRAGWLCRCEAGRSPASSTGASAPLNELFGRRNRVGKLLVLSLLLQVLNRVFLALLSHLIGLCFIHVHDHSPLVWRCVGPHHRGPNVHKVASLPPEKSELRHIGWPPPKKADFGSGDADWHGNRRMRRATNKGTTGTPKSLERPVALSISSRSLVGSMRPASVEAAT